MLQFINNLQHKRRENDDHSADDGYAPAYDDEELEDDDNVRRKGEKAVTKDQRLNFLQHARKLRFVDAIDKGVSEPKLICILTVVTRKLPLSSRIKVN